MLVNMFYVDVFVNPDKLTVLSNNQNNSSSNSNNNGYERTNEELFVSCYINGSILSVYFSQSIGNVLVDITSTSGTTIYYSSVDTPTSCQFYIPNAGNYNVTFTLENNAQYYAEFKVTT